MSVGTTEAWRLTGIEAFVAALPRRIPSLAPMGIRLHRCDRDGLVLVAPLEHHHNDKGTAFAGSVATLAVLTGWAVATLAARSRGCDADVSVARTEIAFARPLASDLHARCGWPAPEDTTRLARTLARGRLARLDLEAVVGEPDNPAPAANARLRYALRSRPTDGRGGD